MLKTALILMVLFGFPLAVYPKEPIDALRAAVANAYAKLDSQSLSCCLYLHTMDDSDDNAMGTVDFRYERKSKQLVISDGVPLLLVEDDSLCLWAFGDLGAVTYLEVKCDHPVKCSDVEAAGKTLETACDRQDTLLTNCPYVLPFLDGGIDRMLPAGADLLDPAAPETKLILTLGHPDGRLMTKSDQDNAKLDPAKNPLCVRVKSQAGTSEYAFDRVTNLLTAVHVVLENDRKNPKRKVDVIVRKMTDFQSDPALAALQPSWDLPATARRMSATELKEAYREWENSHRPAADRK